jgi:hypothetical protein
MNFCIYSRPRASRSEPPGGGQAGAVDASISLGMAASNLLPYHERP